MASVPEGDAAETPASNHFAHRSRTVQVSFAGPKRQFIDGIRDEVMTNVEDAGPFVAGETVHIFRSARLAAAYRPIVDGMRPSVTRLKGQAPGKAPLKRHPQGVVGAGADVPLYIHRAKRISVGIVLIQGAEAFAIGRIKRN